jgi:2-C-methyl-D-erythritol 4-phosphate cytidylyltransferase
MNSALPKQFLPLCGLPVLMRTIRAFILFDEEILIIVALPGSFHSYWRDLCEKYNFSIKHTLVKGGETRFLSVKNSLTPLPDDCLVAIHDGVRPLVSQTTIRNAFSMAEKKGNAVPVIAVSETLRKVEGSMNLAVSRDLFRIVQTPQVFSAKSIKEAYAKATLEDYTDDATVLEAAGHQLFLTEGNPENIKITQPSDLFYAEAIISKTSLSD